MRTVQARPDAAPEAPCPVCGRTSSSSILHDDDGIHVASYICPTGHGWITKWAVVA